MRAMARGMVALAATAALTVGGASAAHGLRVPRVPRFHVHIPNGASVHDGGNAGNCGNGANGSSGGQGPNGTANSGGRGGAKAGKGGPGGHGAKGGKGARC